MRRLVAIAGMLMLLASLALACGPKSDSGGGDAGGGAASRPDPADVAESD